MFAPNTTVAQACECTCCFQWDWRILIGIPRTTREGGRASSRESGHANKGLLLSVIEQSCQNVRT